MNILVAGDDPESNKLLRVTLEDSGHVVHIVENGMQGVLFLETAKDVNLVISDINMPVMNGYTFLMMTRRHERHHNLRFILHSACYTESSHERLASDLGADGFIRKTGHIREISEAIQKILLARIP